MSYLDGLLVHQLVFPDPAFDPAAAVRLLVHGHRPLSRWLDPDRSAEAECQDDGDPATA